MSKYTGKMITAANAIASGAAVVIAGPMSIMEFMSIGLLVENCSTLSMTIQIFAIDSNNRNIQGNLIPSGMVVNTTAVVGPGASQAQAYKLEGACFQGLVITACATASLGASHVRTFFSGRKSD